MFSLVVTVPCAEVELASDRLWGAGVVAIEERSGSGGDSVELWTSLGDGGGDVAEAAAEIVGDRWSWELVALDPSSTERWREHVTPTWIAADYVIVPSWLGEGLPDANEPDAATGQVAPTVVRIDPGASFGLGDHPTTVGSLRALRSTVRAGDRVLDVGCGSGVLGIAAALAGASHVRAVDISIAAVEATNDNARRNGVAELIVVDDAPLAAIDDRFDVVVANILAPTLIELADDLRSATGDDGTLIISGVLAGRADHVLDALAPLRPVDTVTVDGWVAVVLRRVS